MRALMWHEIQELDLCNMYYTASHVMRLPASLFTLQTLVILKLKIGRVRCRLIVPATVSLQKLKLLHIEEASFLCDDIEKLLSSCPALDDLVLDNCRLEINGDSAKLNISNTNLRTLTLRLVSGVSNTKIIEVAINSPALVYLRSILPKEWCLSLGEAEYLAKVVIGCFSQQPPSYANAHDMLRGMKNVQTLQLPDAFIQDLCDCDHHLPRPLYHKLT